MGINGAVYIGDCIRPTTLEAAPADSDRLASLAATPAALRDVPDRQLMESESLNVQVTRTALTCTFVILHHDPHMPSP